MAEFRCARCGAAGPPLERAPLPGEEGQRVLASVCRECWKLWLGEQVRVINENRLTPGDPEHYRKLLAAMQRYLGLEDAR